MGAQQPRSEIYMIQGEKQDNPDSGALREKFKIIPETLPNIMTYKENSNLGFKWE